MLYDGHGPVPNGRKAHNIFVFCCWMAAVAAERRGGRTSDHITDCADFMRTAVGRPLSVSDQLPDEFDWTAASAQDCAMEMMEYDA